jgi:PadR family transcriptional regulator, regulatory protein PadR
MLGELEQVVMLATLRLGDDGYGVTIQEAIRKATGRDLTLGTIHKTLVRLEAKGMIASRMGETAPYRGGRRKRHYAVTPAGLKTLRASINALRRLATGLAVGLERG